MSTTADDGRPLPETRVPERAHHEQGREDAEHQADRSGDQLHGDVGGRSARRDVVRALVLRRAHLGITSLGAMA
jgi:hypothetical protein